MSNIPSREEIEVRAYELYEACGCENGHDLEHWLEAERQLSELDEQASSSIAELQYKAAAAGRQNR
jgi:Protein of unknown function (DUF2934)